MTKYLNSGPMVFGYGTKQYRDNWQRVFGKGKEESTIPCLGREVNTTDGRDYDCDYPYAGAFGCEDCVVNGGSKDPREPQDSDICDECDGSGTYFIDGEPQSCICRESRK